MDTLLQAIALLAALVSIISFVLLFFFKIRNFDELKGAMQAGQNEITVGQVVLPEKDNRGDSPKESEFLKYRQFESIVIFPLGDENVTPIEIKIAASSVLPSLIAVIVTFPFTYIGVPILPAMVIFASFVWLIYSIISIFHCFITLSIPAEVILLNKSVVVFNRSDPSPITTDVRFLFEPALNSIFGFRLNKIKVPEIFCERRLSVVGKDREVPIIIIPNWMRFIVPIPNFGVMASQLNEMLDYRYRNNRGERKAG